MSLTIFYAWQADRDRKVCRNLIQRAAKAAVKQVKADAEVKSAPAIDLDEATKGTTGHPHIASMIRKKIKACGIFLADLTHVAEYVTTDNRSKHAQNPNVLIELGIAIRSKGFARLILVMNDAFGAPDHLPFDLKSHSFPITYTLADASDKASVKAAEADLTKKIADKLKPMLLAVHEAEVAKLKAKEEAERRIEVTCHHSVAVLAGVAQGFIVIKAVNVGVRPVTIDQAMLFLSDGRRMIPTQTNLFGRWKLPIKLQESDKVEVPVEASTVWHELVAARERGQPVKLIAAVVTDTTGNAYRTTDLESFVEETLKPLN